MTCLTIYRSRFLHGAVIGGVILLGVVRVWVAPPIVNEDGVAYFDMADGWLRGDWPTAINPVWSPLYTWVLAAAFRLSGASLGNELVAAHVVNGILYVIAGVTFFIFFREALMPSLADATRNANKTGLPDVAWFAVGSTTFAWTALELIGVEAITPDLCGAAIVYVASYYLLRARIQTRLAEAIALGLACGIGYLGRTAMLPIGIGFIVVSGIRRGAKFNRGMVAVAGAAMFVVASAWILVLSLHVHRLTIGEVGRLSYAWHVNRVTSLYWDGDSRYGRPLRPTRTLQTVPAIYEFGDPRPITYPTHFDPASRFEGLRLRFDVGDQWNAIGRNSRTHLALIREHPEILGACAGLGLMLVAGARRAARTQSVFIIAAPAVWALLVYSVVYTENRYIAPFLAVIIVACLAAIDPAVSGRRRVAAAFGAAVIVVSLSIGVGVSTWRAVRSATAHGTDSSEQRLVADAVISAHARARAHVGRIGASLGAYWARLAQVQIAAELRDADLFWAASRADRERALNSLAGDHRSPIVAFHVPEQADTAGWRRIGSTPHFIYIPSAFFGQ